MFYAHFVLSKKGPLARIWLAAHWDKKLTKTHVFETNIESSVEGILQPKVKLALRTSGHLLLGIVRIYSRKAKYLLADCNEAFIKIKMAFRPGVVDLPEGNREAAVATITLPEVFHDFDTMPDITIDMDAQVTLNQSRAEDITLKEDYGTLSLMTDDGFGDMGFDDAEVARDATNIDEGFDHNSLLLYDEPSKKKLDDGISGAGSFSMSNKQVNLEENLKDGFEASVGVDMLEGAAGGLFEPSGLFDDAPLVSMDNTSAEQALDNSEPRITKVPDTQDDSDDDMYDMGPASMGLPSPPSSPGSPDMQLQNEKLPEPNMNGLNNSHDVPLADSLREPLAPGNAMAGCAIDAANEMPPPPVPQEQAPTTHNEDETFALAPLDSTILQGPERTVKTKRKRKLIVDEVKNISGEEMKAQLSDTTDIVTSLDLAPPTKRLMVWKETGGVEKLFALPGHPILSKTLSRMYQRHLTTRSVDNEEFDASLADDRPDVELEEELEQMRDGPVARKRRREMDMSHIEPPHMDSFHNEMNHSHPQTPLDIHQNFMPQHIFQMQDPLHQQMMMPPSKHMMHQILSDVQQMPHMPPPMMHPTPIGVDQASMHSLPPGMHDLSVPDTFTPVHPSVGDSVQHNLLPESLINDSIVQQQSMVDPLHQPFSEHIDKDPLSSCVNGPVLDNSVASTVDMSQLQNEPLPDRPLAISNSDELTASGLPYPAANDAIANDKQQQATDSSGVNNIDEPLQNAHVNDKALYGALPSDDEDDYGAPGSVGPMYPEEQMADETYEEFEERILTKRTTHMLHMINQQLDDNNFVNFRDIIRNNKRKQVAQKFYTFLVLKKQQAVELQQDKPYGDLLITRGPKFSAVYNA